ncbi:MAG: hypothetical protein FWF29_12945 [Treponema sp.]|nr:hypothetical protein [Treponema sp.]
MTIDSFFIEQRIIEAVKNLLNGCVNEILTGWEYLIPVIDFGSFGSRYAVAPVVSLLSCERTEKERIISLDAYSLSVTFTLFEHEDGELFCYAYSTAFAKALGEDVTLGGIADRAVITGKKYIAPKKPHCGEGWGLELSLRVTVEQ